MTRGVAIRPEHVLSRVMMLLSKWSELRYHRVDPKGGWRPNEVDYPNMARDLEFPPRARGEVYGQELGFSDWDVVRYVWAILRKATETGKRSLVHVWHPYGGRYRRGSNEERNACYHIKRKTQDIGLPRIPAWRVRMGLKRAMEHGLVEQGNLHFPRGTL